MALAFFSGELTEWGNIFFGFRLGIPLGSGGTRSWRDSPILSPCYFTYFPPFLHNVFMNLPDLALFMDLSHYIPLLSFHSIGFWLASSPHPWQHNVPSPRVGADIERSLCLPFFTPTKSMEEEEASDLWKLSFYWGELPDCPPSQKASELTISFAKWKDHSYENI